MARINSITLRGPNGETLSQQNTRPQTPAPLPPLAQRAVGLGDLVEHFAKPIAHLIDAATERFLPADWETRLAGCAACARRRHKLNLLCPDIERCPVLEQLLGILPAGARDGLIEAIRGRVAG